MDFGGWVQNSGANVANDQIIWHGAVDTSTQYIFVFTATQTGGYNETVINTAQVSGTAQSEQRHRPRSPCNVRHR